MQNNFSLNPSRVFAVLLLAIHLFSLAAVMLLPLPLWAKAGVVVCLVFSLIYYLRRDAWLSLPSSCVAFRLQESHIVLIAKNGQEWSGTLLHGSVVTPFMTLLRMAPQDARLARSVVIFSDAIAPESFRMLRVALRWKK